MKIIVYTANIGNYDTLNHIYIKSDNVKFVYFTDSKDGLCGWDKVLIAERKCKDNTKEARYYKCNPHLVLPDHDISIWVDARFQVKAQNVHQYLKDNFKRNMNIACYDHPRDGKSGCSYIEGFVCGANGLDDNHIILKQISRYKADGFPKKNGLFSSGIIIRRNNDKVNQFNEFWWNEIVNGSKRDQISQVYSSWKNGVIIDSIEGSVYKNQLVKKGTHIHKKK